MNKHLSGNSIARVYILIADFAIMNAVVFVCWKGWIVDAPPFFDYATKIVAILANMSLLVAEYFHSTIAHWRMMKISNIARNTFGLSFVQCVILGVLVKLLYPNAGGIFDAMLFIFGSEFVLLFLSRLVEYYLLRYLRRQGRNTRSVILVGNDPAISELYTNLLHDPSYGYRIKGYFADAKNEDLIPQPPYLGTLDELHDMEQKALRNENRMDGMQNPKAESYQSLLEADEVYCCLPQEKAQMIVDLMKYCDRNLIHYFYVMRQFAPYHLSFSPIDFGGLNVFTNHREPLEDPLNRIIKRTFDLVFSSVVCLVLLPLIPIIGLIIKIQSPGPIFFGQERTGFNGKNFKCYKFRSMHVNKDADKIQATEHDVRKFAFGNFMRKCNIDELPQFFNVLIGDMSVVGPRPHMLYHTEHYSKLINEYMVRHLCKPGITGLAQVSGYRGETKELWQMKDRVRLDIWYIENWSVWLDLSIIAKTVVSIFKPDKNAY